MVARRVVSLLALAFLAVGCRPGAVGGPEPGATSSENVVKEFLFAARAQDLQALSAVWGNDVSPVRDRMERRELEQRLLIIMCHLKHDESRFAQAQAGAEGRTLQPVELTQGTMQQTTTFTTVRNKESGRWFVENLDLTPLRGFCTQMPPPGGSRVPPA